MTESFVRAIKRVGHWPANVALLAVGYWVAVRVGLFLVVQPEGVASIWPASGVALAALLLNPRRRWPVLLAVIFLVNAGGNWSGGNPLSASLGFALANTLEPLFAGWVLTHFCGERITFRRIKEMVVLFAAATLCNGVTALVGAGVAALAFDAPLMSTWWVWWASDGLGMAMVTAVIVTWVADPAVLRSASWMRLAEAVVFVIAVTGLTWLVFAPFTVAEHSVLRAYMLLPLIAWIAFRFSPRDTAGTLLLIALIALWNTRQGYGIFAFAADSPSERLVAVQTFLILLTLLGLLLSAETFERREAAESLRRSEEGLKRAQHHARVGSWTWDINEDRLEWSDEMFRIFGLRKETFTGSLQAVIAEAIHPDDRAAVERSNLSVVRDRRPIPLEYRVVRPDGSVRVVWAEAGEFLPDEHGDPLLLSGTVRDITEQKEAEANKARLESQLQHAIKMESVGRLAGGVAHDFNNMLGVILGHMELALEQVDSSHPVHADLIATQQAAQRSAHLTRQLLAFARKQAVVPRVLDLNETVAGMLTMLERLIGEDIEISFSPAGGLWPVSMDPSQIDQILANLCVNARDAIAGTGCISIETTNESLDEDHCVEHPGCIPGDYVRLVVADDGRGMDEETRRHLFEPFFTTKNTGEGTGLGLATVYGIVEQNGGFIEVESEAGEGCTFTIYLPRHVGDAPPADTGEPRGSSTRGREIILVVEDEPAILDLATRMLRRQGYIVLAAATPAQAIRLAEERQGDIDLLVTDVVMPEMNGRDLADTLRTYAPRMRRLFMSGYTADVIASRGVLDDGVNFLEKPFTAQGFAAAVREVLSRE